MDLIRFGLSPESGAEEFFTAFVTLDTGCRRNRVLSEKDSALDQSAHYVSD
jgi:hypothetical protein